MVPGCFFFIAFSVWMTTVSHLSYFGRITLAARRFTMISALAAVVVSLMVGRAAVRYYK